MDAQRREQVGSFMYEPTCPPTIPPGQTIAQWRRNRMPQRPRPRWSPLSRRRTGRR